MKKYQIPERYCKACTSFIEAKDMKTFACPICGCDYGVVETDGEDLSTGDKIEIITAFLNAASIEDVNSVYGRLFEGDYEVSDGYFEDLTRNTPVGKRFKWKGEDLCKFAACMPVERFDKKPVIFKRQ